MKKHLLVLAAVLVIVTCLSVAAVASTNRQAKDKAANTTQVKALQAQLTREQAVSVLHDQANTLAVKKAGDQIILLTTQKTTICNQLKAARLVQPLCNQ